jgi:hypothetical protein
MTNPSIADNDPPRRSRTRRREAMINAIATVLGCMALVVMIATMVRVVMVKLWESSKVNPEYVQSVMTTVEWSAAGQAAVMSKPRCLQKTAPRFSPTKAQQPSLRLMLPPVTNSLPLTQEARPPAHPTSPRRCVQHSGHRQQTTKDRNHHPWLF